MSASGQVKNLPPSWGPAEITMLTWCPSSSWLAESLCEYLFTQVHLFLTHTLLLQGSVLLTDTDCTAFGLLDVMLSVAQLRRCTKLQYSQLCVIRATCCRCHKVLGVQGCRWQLCAEQECGTEGASYRHGGHQISSHGLAGEEQSTQVLLVSTAYGTASQFTSVGTVQQCIAGTPSLRMLHTTCNVWSHCMLKQVVACSTALIEPQTHLQHVDCHSNHTSITSCIIRWVQVCAKL